MAQCLQTSLARLFFWFFQALRLFSARGGPAHIAVGMAYEIVQAHISGRYGQRLFLNLYGLLKILRCGSTKLGGAAAIA